MENENKSSVEVEEARLIIKRKFDSPLLLVWRAWTESEQLKQWICPKDFVVTETTGDLRPGGSWQTAMRSPEGKEHMCGGNYLELREPNRLVFTHAWKNDETGEMGHATQITVELSVEGDGTLMRFEQSGFKSNESRDGHQSGWNGAFEHLESLLHQGNQRKLCVEAHGHNEIVMTRAFDAPRELVFDAFTKPDMVRRWMLGPPGWTMPTCDIDFKVGGKFRYVWRDPDGNEMGMGGTYQEITPPERIVNVETFDKDWTGGETLVTSVFTEVDGTTLLTTTVRYSSQEARDAVLESPMAEGLGQSYDKLETLLVKDSI